MSFRQHAARAVLAIAGAVCLATGTYGQSLTGTLLVANREDIAGSLSLFDLPTGKEIARIPIGPGWPHEVSVSPDGRVALTAEYGLDAPGERVVVIDIPSAEIRGIIDTGPGTKPHDTVFLPDGRHALVTLETTDELAVLDIEAFSVVRRMPIGAGAREGHMIRLSADGEHVYVGGRLGDGTVSVVDVSGETPPAVIQTGPGAEAIEVAATGNVWVLNQDANTISVIDPDTLTILETFASATQPRRLANLPGNRLAVINGNADTAGIRIYDVANREVIESLDVPGDRVAAGGFGFLTIGTHAFVSTRADGRILLYDLDRPGVPPRTFARDHDTPDGMAWSPLRVAVLDDR
jgi:DNA-binding beta-propeller fold protein YncE